MILRRNASTSRDPGLRGGQLLGGAARVRRPVRVGVEREPSRAGYGRPSRRSSIGICRQSGSRGFRTAYTGCLPETRARKSRAGPGSVKSSSGRSGFRARRAMVSPGAASSASIRAASSRLKAPPGVVVCMASHLPVPLAGSLRHDQGAGRPLAFPVRAAP